MFDCAHCPLYLLFRAVFDGETDHFTDRVISMIKEVVSIQCGVSVADIESKSRSKKLVFARRVAMRRCREFDIPLNVIGRAFNRSHSTVINALKPLSTFWRA